MIFAESATNKRRLVAIGRIKGKKAFFCFVSVCCSGVSKAAMASGVQKLVNKVKSGAREIADSLTPTLKVRT